VGITAGAAITGIAASFALPFAWLWLTAPVVQRNEARQEIPAVEHRAEEALEAEQSRFEEMDKNWREAWEKVNEDRERIRGLLGQAEGQVHEANVPPGTKLARAAVEPRPEPKRRRMQLPERLPMITADAAVGYLAEIERLREEAEPLIERAWDRELKSKRSMGTAMLGRDIIEAAQGWNERVHALGDKTMSVKERARISVLQPPFLRTFSLAGYGMDAEKVEGVLRDNLGTLDLIDARCKKAVGQQEGTS
jgi:hypothetical protein